MPARVDGEDSIDYVVRRTLMRPRDIIVFFNRCIERAEGSPAISATQIKEAEGTYSRDRLRSLADEWYADFPNLLRFVELSRKEIGDFG